jgi:hypothetical protein
MRKMVIKNVKVMRIFAVFFGRDSGPSNLHDFLKTVVRDGGTSRVW